jgi:hypothetical protein
MPKIKFSGAMTHAGTYYEAGKVYEVSKEVAIALAPFVTTLGMAAPFTKVSKPHVAKPAKEQTDDVKARVVGQPKVDKMVHTPNKAKNGATVPTASRDEAQSVTVQPETVIAAPKN